MIQKHCNLAAIPVFSAAPTLFWALHSRRLASGPRTAGGRQKLQSECGIGGSGRHGGEREREINMQEEGKRARLQTRGYARRFEGGFNGASKK